MRISSIIPLLLLVKEEEKNRSEMMNTKETMMIDYNNIMKYKNRMEFFLCRLLFYNNFFCHSHSICLFHYSSIVQVSFAFFYFISIFIIIIGFSTIFTQQCDNVIFDTGIINANMHSLMVCVHT